jgi:succinoglycan biosynthesis transport protein ExoP
MLQSNPDRLRPGVGNLNALPAGDENGLGTLLLFLRGFLHRQYGIIAFTVALALAAAVLYLRVTPPVYTAHIQLLLANPKAQFVQQESILAEPSFDRGGIDTQLQIINSPAIATAVIDQLHLAPDLTASGSSPLAPLKNLMGWFRKKADPAKLQSDEIVESFLKRMSATRIALTNVIDVSFNWNNPARAAEIANAIGKAYITDQLNAKFEANRTATLWLQQRIQQLGDQAETAERAVNAYKTQHNIVSSEGKSVDEQQITDLSSRLVAARAQTADLQARLNRYESVLKQAPADPQSIGTLDTAGSDVLTSPIITGLRQQYLELARRESEYSARFGSGHLSVVNLRTRLQELRSSIFDEVRRLAETTRSDYNVGQQREQDLEKQLADAVAQSRATNSAEVTLRELDSKAKNYRTLYGTFLQRYMGSAQQETFPISEARVIYPAFPPDTKSKPKTMLILALALFGGVGLGGGLGLVREMMDRVFRTPGQVEAALGLPCLSVVPLLQVANRTRKAAEHRSGTDSADGQDLNRIVSTASASHWAVVNMPLSRFAEAMRSVKLGIELRSMQSSNKVIGITSSLPHEGKSTMAASLAQLIAEAGKSVILIDCDLRNPSLSSALAPNATTGLLEVISGGQQIDEIIWKEPKTGMVFLPAVKRLHLLHSSEILMTEQMRKLFERLRSNYDYVIVDLPPLSPIVDVRATAPLVDCFVLVVEWAKTKIDVVQHALHTAPNVYENLAGVVLNKTDIKSMARYDYYSSDYYNDDHYLHYGLTDRA